MDLREMLAKGCVVVDVRTPEEFRSGHVTGSINIPLQELSARRDEVLALKQPLVLCCASGVRSETARRWCHEAGLECFNGGS